MSNNSKNSLYLLMYSPTYYIYLPLPVVYAALYYSCESSVFSVNTSYMTSFYNTYWHFFQHVFKVFFRPFFLKLRFRGKGYYVYKNYRNTIAPQFGYYHRIYIYSFFNAVFFLSKITILFVSNSPKDILLSSRNLKTMRPINIFTGKGVRFAKQLIYKKAGKISSYR